MWKKIRDKQNLLFIVDENGDRIAEIYCGDEVTGTLIASTPKMLEMLKDIANGKSVSRGKIELLIRGAQSTE